MRRVQVANHSRSCTHSRTEPRGHRGSAVLFEKKLEPYEEASKKKVARLTRFISRDVILDTRCESI